MEPEQKPVGEAHQMSELVEGFTHCIWDARVIPVGTKLYTSPPQRTWVRLTDEQWQVIADTLNCVITRSQKNVIESKIKEKNHE
jgi:hypothetical protein